MVDIRVSRGKRCFRVLIRSWEKIDCADSDEFPLIIPNPSACGETLESMMNTEVGSRPPCVSADDREQGEGVYRTLPVTWTKTVDEK